MSVVTAYHVFVCALFLVQGGMWTGYGLSLGVFVRTTHLSNNNGIFIILTRDLTSNYTCSLMMICNVLSKYVGTVKLF
jgi:hypothetical protein